MWLWFTFVMQIRMFVNAIHIKTQRMQVVKRSERLLLRRRSRSISSYGRHGGIVQRLVEKKVKLEEELTLADFDRFVNEYEYFDPFKAKPLTKDDRDHVHPFQASALLMALTLKGMSQAEIEHMAQAICRTGIQLDWKELDQPTVSLYSGVGDKSSLIVAPICAASGVSVPKISDRVITGGIVDKILCIPGINVNLSPSEFQKVVKNVGAAMVAPFPEMVQADKALKNLRRDTYDSIPLIAASIMGKRLAAGADSYMFDVKTGKGDHFLDVEEALELGKSLVSSAIGLNRNASAFVTGMHQPLGFAFGNLLEVQECIGILEGDESTSSANLRDIAVLLAAQILVQSNICSSAEEGMDIAINCIKSGQAMEKFKEMIRAQGGDLDKLPKLPSMKSHRIIEVHYSENEDKNKNKKSAQSASDVVDASSTAGVVASDQYEGKQISEIDSWKLGELVKNLGNDHESGILLRCSISDEVENGMHMCTVYTSRDDLDEASIREQIFDAFSVESGQVQPSPLIYYFIDHTGREMKLH